MCCAMHAAQNIYIYRAHKHRVPRYMGVDMDKVSEVHLTTM